MIRILGVFIVLLAAIYLGLWLHNDPGYVFIATHHWTIESTLWLTLFILVIVLLGLHGVLDLFKKFFNLSKRCQQWRKNKRLDKAQAKLSLTEYNEGNWQTLYALLPTIKSSKLIPDPAFKLFQQHVYRHYFQHLVTTRPPQEIKQWIDALPKALKYDPEIMYHYCHFLLSQHEDNLAEPLLRRCLQTHIDPALLDLYRQLNIKTLRVAFIESLLKKNPNSAAVNLCMGRIFCAQKLWGTAKDYIEKSIQIHPCREAYYELGHLFESLGNQTDASQAYKQGLLKSVVSVNHHS